MPKFQLHPPRHLPQPLLSLPLQWPDHQAPPIPAALTLMPPLILLPCDDFTLKVLEAQSLKDPQYQRYYFYLILLSWIIVTHQLNLVQWLLCVSTYANYILVFFLNETLLTRAEGETISFIQICLPEENDYQIYHINYLRVYYIRIM